MAREGQIVTIETDDTTLRVYAHRDLLIKTIPRTNRKEIRRHANTESKTTEAAAPPLVLGSPRRIRGRSFRPPGCFKSRCARRAFGAPWTPEPPRPLRQGNAGRPSLPHPGRGHHKTEPPVQPTHDRSLRSRGLTLAGHGPVISCP
jgi:hypothetical protein